MRRIYFLGLLIALLTASCTATKQEESQDDTISKGKPNIIFIMADDMGYGDLGCYGQEIIQTPSIDKMASEGMKFTQHYAGSPVCAPSRAVLMTGLHPGHAFVRGNKQAEPYGQVALPDQEVTVAEMMKKAGYATALFGKWGLGVEKTEGEPTNQGFDHYLGYLDQVLAHNYYPEYLHRNGERVYLNNEVKYLDSTQWHKGLGSYSTKQVDYTHDIFTREALRYIEENKDTSFFLYLPYTIPHNNGEAPLGERQEVPDFGIYADKDWDQESKGYAAMISRLDGDVGKIMEKLNSLGIAENTLIIFTSDNGPMRADQHTFTKRFNSNGPLKGFKRDLYEGGVRIPMIAWWPGTIASNTTSDHISAFWDFLPAACDVAGIAPPADVDGISYLPELTGKDQKEHEYLYWEFPENGYQVAVRKGKWKAIKRNMQENPDASIELYNLSEDLGEENNIADQHPEIIEEMKAIMEKARTPSEHFPMPGKES